MVSTNPRSARTQAQQQGKPLHPPVTWNGIGVDRRRIARHCTGSWTSASSGNSRHARCARARSRAGRQTEGARVSHDLHTCPHRAHAHAPRPQSATPPLGFQSSTRTCMVRLAVLVVATRHPASPRRCQPQLLQPQPQPRYRPPHHDRRQPLPCHLPPQLPCAQSLWWRRCSLHCGRCSARYSVPPPRVAPWRRARWESPRRRRPTRRARTAACV